MNSTTTQCVECGRRTDNPKFCGRSCSVTYGNRKRPKRTKMDKICELCGLRMPEAGYLFTRCKDCKRPQRTRAENEAITKKDFLQGGNGLSARYRRIRSLAREKYMENLLNPACVLCGYDLHVEVCHILAIEDHPDTALIGEINDLKNLIGLCRNHHWELDNGVLNPVH